MSGNENTTLGLEGKVDLRAGGSVSRRMEGKAVLVTGAGGAIGRATARRLADEGAHLALADRDETLLAKLADEVAAAAIIRHDAMSMEASSGVVDEAAAALGGLDGVCNIAGVQSKIRSTETSDEDWLRVMQVNLNSVFAICRAAIPHLRVTGGSVVNTSSLAALKGFAYSNAYAASKAGVIALTKSLAAEHASEGIRFNAVCPGGIRTGMTTVPTVSDADPDLAFRRSKLKGFEGGIGEPRDVAAAFAYLLSEDARFVSGSVLVVDGAQLLV